jgi:methyl-accepting chemotaxis protein
MVLAAPLVALGAIVVVASYGLSETSERFDEIFGMVVPENAAMAEAEKSVSEALAKAQCASLAGDSNDRKELLRQARLAMTNLEAAAQQLHDVNVATHPEEALEAKESVQPFVSAMTPVLAMIERDTVIDSEKAQEIMRGGLSEARKPLEKIASEMKESRAEIQHAAISQVATLRTNLTYASIGAGAISLALGGVLASRLCRKISILSKRLHQIAAGEGELEARTMVVPDRAELGVLAESFNTYANQIGTLVGQFDGMARDVSGAAAQIAAASEEMNTTVKNQSVQVGEITHAVDELAGGVLSAKETSRQAADAAAHAGELASRGEESVRRTIEVMELIESAVTDGARSVEELGKRSEQIGRIVSVINDIADQTNLLALNAAIEAARAGEHGRGFAVVADEVRKLAERTSTATREVTDSIKLIQGETGNAVKRMHAGTAEVKTGMTRAGEASSSLREIVASVSQTAAMFATIADAIAKQGELGETIRARIAPMTTSTDESAEAAMVTACSANTLAEKSRSLQSAIQEFKRDKRAGA